MVRSAEVGRFVAWCDAQSLPPRRGATVSQDQGDLAPSDSAPSDSAIADLSAELHRLLADLGCDRVGIASAEPFEEARRSIEAAKSSGRHAGMHFTFGQPYRSTSVGASFPWAESLLVAGRSYVPAAGTPGPAQPNHGRVARFATDDHYAPLRSALEAAAERLRALGHRASVVVDDNRLVDRAAAVRAGVGWWGKNAMVLAPRVGPWMLLGSVVTDAQLEPTAPMVRDCGTCDACLPACPTGALVAPGVLDARLCIAYLLQSPDWIPRELRAAIGDRIYGCDDCLDACPPGRKLEATALDAPRLEVRGLLELSDDELLDRFAAFYIPRRRAEYLRRNFLIALGNSGDGRAVPVVARHVAHDDPMVRAHSAWALGRLGGAAAKAALEAARASEVDPEVLEEIVAALGDAA